MNTLLIKVRPGSSSLALANIYVWTMLCEKITVIIDNKTSEFFKNQGKFQILERKYVFFRLHLLKAKCFIEFKQ